MSREVLGVDIGGVIIDRINDNTDTSFFGDNYLQTTEVPEVFDALRVLNKYHFGGRIHLVSKAGAKTEARSKEWLLYHNFFTYTGISSRNVHFCRTRPEKAPICKRLGITHFVDDRPEVLNYLDDIVDQCYLFRPTEKELAEHLGTGKPPHEVYQSWYKLAITLLLRC